MANLVFKFNWEHRPFPYNSAQSKRQFMLPFASGIPNLTPSFSQVVGVASIAQGGTGGTSVESARSSLDIKLGGFNGSVVSPTTDFNTFTTEGLTRLNFSMDSTTLNGPPLRNATNSASGVLFVLTNSAVNSVTQLFFSQLYSQDAFYLRFRYNATQWSGWIEIKHSGNTSIDGNGFIKAASPIVKLFEDRIELNDSAKLQPIVFEKLSIGDYLISGSLGFAKEGWYIEMPKDANGNIIVAVAYEQLENGDISVKTYKKKFDIETASIVPDYSKPIDIPETRWIDLRLHEEPEPILEIDNLPGETPMNFQPTNLSQAVAAAMEGVDLPEVQDE